MSQRTIKRTPSILPGAHATKVVWKILSASSRVPEEYAQKLEKALNTLASEDFALVAMTEREGTTIIHGQKFVADTPVLPVFDRTAPEVSAVPKTVHNEVTYAYLDKGELHQVRVETLQAATQALSGHLQKGGVTPISITTAVLSTFEPHSFEALLAAYAERSPT